VKLAVFTAQFPSRVSTFFERDMRALLQAGIQVDVFSIYPLDASLWQCTLELLGESVLPRERIHHLGGLAAIRGLLRPAGGAATFLRESAGILGSAVGYGPMALAKTGYVLPKAWAWAREYGDRYDHVLAYWGNYAGTCAYLFHRLSGRDIPYSLWLHAGTDLYRGGPFLRQKLAHADCVVTCCDFNRRFIHEHYPDLVPRLEGRIHVTYHGLDLSTFPFQPEGREPGRIIAVGRLAERKGFDYLLRAIADLQARRVPVTLELLGEGEHRRGLEEMARELGIADRVRFHGWVPFDQVRTAMSQATMLVHPSAGLGDGLPNVLREAMALGTPVIASNVAGIPEALDEGRCGLLVPPRDVAALGAAIERMLHDAVLRREFAAKARKLTESKFDLWHNGTTLADRLRGVQRRHSLAVESDRLTAGSVR
jgi:colanic acid/amylovoran biosynthesis glycosyltransferase